MVYDGYSYSGHGVYKPAYNYGAARNEQVTSIEQPRLFGNKDGGFQSHGGIPKSWLVLKDLKGKSH